MLFVWLGAVYIDFWQQLLWGPQVFLWHSSSCHPLRIKLGEDAGWKRISRDLWSTRQNRPNALRRSPPAGRNSILFKKAPLRALICHSAPSVLSQKYFWSRAKICMRLTKPQSSGISLSMADIFCTLMARPNKNAVNVALFLWTAGQGIFLIVRWLKAKATTPSSSLLKKSKQNSGLL